MTIPATYQKIIIRTPTPNGTLMWGGIASALMVLFHLRGNFMTHSPPSESVFQLVRLFHKRREPLVVTNPGTVIDLREALLENSTHRPRRKPGSRGPKLPALTKK
jgi:hypothetical protein